MGGGRWQAERTRPCGTQAAYARHVRQGTKPCAQCVAAHNVYQRKEGNRIAERARRDALRELAARHPDEYEALRAGYLRDRRAARYAAGT